MQVGQANTLERPWYWSQPWLDPQWQQDNPWWRPGWNPWWFRSPWFSYRSQVIVLNVTLDSGRTFEVGPFDRQELPLVLRVIRRAADEPFTYSWRFTSGYEAASGSYHVGQIGSFWLTLLSVSLGIAGGQLLYDVAKEIWEDYQRDRGSNNPQSIPETVSARVMASQRNKTYLPRKR